MVAVKLTLSTIYGQLLTVARIDKVHRVETRSDVSSQVVSSVMVPFVHCNVLTTALLYSCRKIDYT